MNLFIPSVSGFGCFKISYHWICAACDEAASETHVGHQGSPIALPSIPKGWTIVEGGFTSKAYCPAHAVTVAPKGD